jgi:hypothetical protein
LRESGCIPDVAILHDRRYMTISEWMQFVTVCYRCPVAVTGQGCILYSQSYGK